MKKIPFTHLRVLTICIVCFFYYTIMQIVDNCKSEILHFAFGDRNGIGLHKSFKDTILRYYSMNETVPNFTSSCLGSNHYGIDLYKKYQGTIKTSWCRQVHTLCVTQMPPNSRIHIAEILFTSKSILKDSEDKNCKNNVSFFRLELFSLSSVKDFIFGHIFCSVNKRTSLNTFISYFPFKWLIYLGRMWMYAYSNYNYNTSRD